jgi:hypothetical protein
VLRRAWWASLLIVGRLFVGEVLAESRLVEALQRALAHVEFAREAIELAAMVEGHGVEVVDEPLLERKAFFERREARVGFH